MRNIASAALLAMLLNLPASAQLMPGHPLSGLEKLKDFEAMRSSSSADDWRNGNGDARPIKPGETLVLGELEGPGMISHIWCTVSHEAKSYSRLLTLRMYWDGEEHPSVEAPLGDFFGIGHGVDKAFVSLPIRVSSEGRARNCYWPMPFRKSAKITVTNDSDKRCGAFYFYVDWQKHKSIPENAAYFHAMYRQEHPCVMGRNYLLADIAGKGHYVGTIQSVYHVSPGWYGEGDDFFFIDGEAEPRLRGTGTEDYFCDAWGFREQDGPFYGTPLWEGGNTGNRGTAYRFHIADPVPFNKSLRVEIEHKGSQKFPDGTSSGFIERDDLMSSVALWYQLEPHKPWPALPPGNDRLPYQEKQIVVGWSAVDKSAKASQPLTVQPMGGRYTGGKQLWFRPKEEGGWVEVNFTTDKEVKGELLLTLTTARDYGTYRALLDGREAGKFDLYNPTVMPRQFRLATESIAQGEHVLRFECTGKSGASTGYYFGLDSLVSRQPVYSRPADVDLRTLQK